MKQNRTDIRPPPNGEPAHPKPPTKSYCNFNPRYFATATLHASARDVQLTVKDRMAFRIN
jgi:hypothetical protein